MAISQGTVIRGQQAGFGNQQSVNMHLNTLGELVVMDWLQKAVMDGSAYQIRAGTITTPITGDVLITDTAAEMSADCANGTTIIPVRFSIAFETIGGTLPEVAVKSVATVSSSGTAFTPLPIRTDSPAAVSSARVQGAGAVTVTAELGTTTLRHLQAVLAAVAAAGAAAVINQTLVPAPVLVGPRSVYAQVGSVTTGSTYFADLDYVEYSTSLVER